MAATMSPSQNDPHPLRSQQDLSHQPEHEEPGESNLDSAQKETFGDPGEEDEEEPGECPFCLFMKAGPCRDNFIQWEECVQTAEEAKEDIVEKCHQITFLLKECMEANADYYEPVLQAEKAMEDAALEEQAAATTQHEQTSSSDAPTSQEGHTNLEASRHEESSSQYVPASQEGHTNRIEGSSADVRQASVSKVDENGNVDVQPRPENTYEESSGASHAAEHVQQHSYQ